ncbi:hypothetical protein HDU84_004254, partial [Entophlyctis sp. JEL0112]
MSPALRRRRLFLLLILLLPLPLLMLLLKRPRPDIPAPPSSDPEVEVGLPQAPTSLSSEAVCVPEAFPMRADAYLPPDDYSTTIILNVFKGTPASFRIQLEAALTQKNAAVHHVWVNAFDSPSLQWFEREYNSVSNKQKDGHYGPNSPKLSFTKSTFNYKFHGRFLLGLMAPTKYLLIVDDDASFGSDAVANLVELITKKHRGVWGSFGHLRGSGVPNQEYRSWPNVKINLTEYDHYEMDYLSGMWFIEQGWLEYFFKDRVWTWETGEDIHLSAMLRKYLNLNTYGGIVSRNAPSLPPKGHTATKGRYFEMREWLADHHLGRGNKLADVRPTIDTLVYAETAEQLSSLTSMIGSCGPDSNRWWCGLGKTAAVFRGSCRDQDVAALISASKELCDATNCKSFALKSEFKHPIEFFNMRQNFGHDHEEVPLHTTVADLVPSLTGVLQNVTPRRFLYAVHQCRDVQKGATGSAGVYLAVARTAFEAFVSTPQNFKFSEGNHTIRADSSVPHLPDTVGLMWNGERVVEHNIFGVSCFKMADTADDSIHVMDFMDEFVRGCNKRSLEVLLPLTRQIQTSVDEGIIPTSLSLAGNKIKELKDKRLHDEYAIVLMHALNNNSFLKMIDLSYNEIGDHGAEAIASFLQNDVRLRKVVLRSNSITETGGIALAKALVMNDFVEEFDISSNAIGNGGGMEFALTLQARNAGIRVLDISDNENNFSRLTQSCANDVIMHLARMVGTNLSIDRLSLAKMGISDFMMCQYLAKALLVNKKDEGAEAISVMLTYNQTLQMLFLDHNRIAGKGLRNIADALLTKNKTLYALRLWGNFWDEYSCVDFSPLVGGPRNIDKESLGHKIPKQQHNSRLLPDNVDFCFYLVNNVLH